MAPNVEPDSGSAPIHLQWGLRIPLRDGVTLSATLYLPQRRAAPAPVIFTLTPYVGQRYHDEGIYFAERGYPFLTVDVRGRGNSGGEFVPYVHDAQDGYDIVEWLATQPYCNGKVAMWGASYGGRDQWATAQEAPPHLAVIAPAASPYMGVDVPFRGNIFTPYLMQWLTLVSGRTSQDNLFWNRELFWGAKFREWIESGQSFASLDGLLGNPSPVFQQWLSHPRQDAYWDSLNPTPTQYARIDIPVLTITGIYDADQPGALRHYREHLKAASHQAREIHYLVIGPWDHGGTRMPRAEFAGLKAGPLSLVDLRRLHWQWYTWTLRGGPRPEFLKKKVAYYVMGAERWRYADTLEEITSHATPLYLHSTANPDDPFTSGSLRATRPGSGGPDFYRYDPRDLSLAALESTVDPDSAANERLVFSSVGRQLVYHSEPFDTDTEISGFFKFSAWLAIDQPDTDFRVAVYDVGRDGRGILMTHDLMRARYRESLREERLVKTRDPLQYNFEGFLFVARQIQRGHRLRLVFGPLHSIYSEKNYNSGGVVSHESMTDARVVTVKLLHDEAHPSALFVPFGQPETGV